MCDIHIPNFRDVAKVFTRDAVFSRGFVSKGSNSIKYLFGGDWARVGAPRIESREINCVAPVAAMGEVLYT